MKSSLLQTFCADILFNAFAFVPIRMNIARKKQASPSLVLSRLDLYTNTTQIITAIIIKVNAINNSLFITCFTRYLLMVFIISFGPGRSSILAVCHRFFMSLKLFMLFEFLGELFFYPVDLHPRIHFS